MFEITYFGALAAGLLSFLSPCILPIVPFYLSYLAGVGVNQVEAETRVSSAVKLRAFLSACLFALGVITVFMGLGATASTFGQLVREYFDVLRWIAHDYLENQLGILEVERAPSVDVAISLAHDVVGPPQNFVVVDRDGRVGWTVIGAIPRRFGHDGRLPSSWADSTRGNVSK